MNSEDCAEKRQWLARAQLAEAEGRSEMARTMLLRASNVGTTPGYTPRIYTPWVLVRRSEQGPMIVGIARHYARGWRFFPRMPGYARSKKHWPDPQACVPVSAWRLATGEEEWLPLTSWEPRD